ncbi:hypothetical protein QQ045_021358 [Rhodiola kirilowii]
MKLKQLEGLLGDLQQFDNPKVELEQYPTGPHIASRMLYTADFSFGDVTDKVVADFGCGCGTLGIAAALLDAGHVIGIDVDAESLETASGNAADLEVNVDFIQCDIGTFRWRGQIIDTVVMNPPFGTRKKGADMDFLQKALKIASGAVYSLHKTTTREHIKRTALRDYNATSAEVICELRYDVPQMYKFHKKKEVDIAVDLWRFVPQLGRTIPDRSAMEVIRREGVSSRSQIGLQGSGLQAIRPNPSGPSPFVECWPQPKPMSVPFLWAWAEASVL